MAKQEDKPTKKERKVSNKHTIKKRSWDSETIMEATAASCEHSPTDSSAKKGTKVVIRNDPYIRRSDLIAFLKENLKIEVYDGNFIEPNKRCVKLVLEGEPISEINFNIVQRREYEG